VPKNSLSSASSTTYSFRQPLPSFFSFSREKDNNLPSVSLSPPKSSSSSLFPPSIGFFPLPPDFFFPLLAQAIRGLYVKRSTVIFPFWEVDIQLQKVSKTVRLGSLHFCGDLPDWRICADFFSPFEQAFPAPLSVWKFACPFIALLLLGPTDSGFFSLFTRVFFFI